MKILHTSDWHLGRTLYEKTRYDESAAFLNWIKIQVEQEKVDVILIAGDIFDTAAPPHKAQEQYYKFISGIAHSSCKNVVIIAGNHDSPAFLEAPKSLLTTFNVDVIGAASGNIDDEVLTLKNHENKPYLIVCAVPFLRDRDIRISEAGESIEQKENMRVNAISEHYKRVYEAALQRQKQIYENDSISVPIIGMGHVFAAGGKVGDGEGVRELYVGSLGRVTRDTFPNGMKYVALGHLHSEQCVAGDDTVRYSGSPMPMSFADAGQTKSVSLIELNANEAPHIKKIQIPQTQRMERITGTFEQIKCKIQELALQDRSIWLEVIYDDVISIPNLVELLHELTAQTKLDILRVQNLVTRRESLSRVHLEESLGALTHEEVFKRCIESAKITEDDQKLLWETYNEAVMLYEQNQIDSNLFIY